MINLFLIELTLKHKDNVTINVHKSDNITKLIKLNWHTNYLSKNWPKKSCPPMNAIHIIYKNSMNKIAHNYLNSFTVNICNTKIKHWKPLTILWNIFDRFVVFVRRPRNFHKDNIVTPWLQTKQSTAALS